MPCDIGLKPRQGWLLGGSDGCDIAAPFGLDDLLNLVLRPTSRFRFKKRAI